MRVSTTSTRLLLFPLWVSTSVVCQPEPQPIMPSPDKPWYKIDETTEFQPALRRLEESLAQESIYADSIDTYYDAYQTAWRYLGFYVECTPFEENYQGNDEDDEEVRTENGQQRCRRNLLWAAVRYFSSLLFSSLL
jgi:hypothetical protein